LCTECTGRQFDARAYPQKIRIDFYRFVRGLTPPTVVARAPESTLAAAASPSPIPPALVGRGTSTTPGPAGWSTSAS
jgi:hypothetical protein